MNEISPGIAKLDPTGRLAEALRAADRGDSTVDEVLAIAVEVLSGSQIVTVDEYRNFFQCGSGCSHRLSYVALADWARLTLVRVDERWAAAPRGALESPPFWYALFE